MYSPWACVIKVCLNGGATYIIGKIIAKNSLNIVNKFKPLKTFFSKLLNRILRYGTKIV